MINVQKYIDAKYRYDFKASPLRVSSLQSAKKNGINCVTLFHLILKDLYNIKLPSNLMSYEMTNDNNLFEDVSYPEQMESGDIVGFGVKKMKTLEVFRPKFKGKELTNWEDFPVKHFAVYTGRKSKGEPLMLHASSVDGTVSVWALKQFAEYRNYATVYYIKRLKKEFRGSNKNL